MRLKDGTRAPDKGRLAPAELKAAKAAARERYTIIADLLKAEAGIRRHYEYKKIAGLAWTNEGKILAPAGVTRRQLYVLAHECAHIVLHSHPAGQSKPGHVKEHEAETYAHRAFTRYDLEVPEKSARWARAYVGQWIMKDRAEGIPICPMAEQFATGGRAPHDPLPAVDGNPTKDFSKQVALHTAQSLRIAAKQDANAPQLEFAAKSVAAPKQEPNACGTCAYLGPPEYSGGDYQCKAYLIDIKIARFDFKLCADGSGWRPRRLGILRRIWSAIFGG